MYSEVAEDDCLTQLESNVEQHNVALNHGDTPLLHSDTGLELVSHCSKLNWAIQALFERQGNIFWPGSHTFGRLDPAGRRSLWVDEVGFDEVVYEKRHRRKREDLGLSNWVRECKIGLTKSEAVQRLDKDVLNGLVHVDRLTTTRKPIARGVAA